MLLEELRRCVGGTYLSDLKMEPFNSRARRIAQAFAAAQYTSEEWNEALCYLVPGAASQPDAASARAALILRPE